ncbi:MAG: amidohydrolase family protein [Ferruginibacter sp.]
MQKIDAHQHFWQFEPVRDSWINDEMKVIQRNFLPGDLHPLLQEFDFDGCVVVQSDQSELENEFQLLNAEQFDFIKGIVGWVDLQAANILERLAFYSSFKKIKGFRHVLQGEADRALMLKPAFMHGISQLENFGFTYDILVFPDQLIHVEKFVQHFPNQKFVIDHIAKPNIKEGGITEWSKQMLAIAAHKNVYCKISGMVTEANWSNWKMDNFAPYLDTIVQAFGTDRIMFGSDWPVCLVAASYEQVLQIVTEYFANHTQQERDQFFGLNAIEFYNL